MKINETIYLDHQATTPLDPEVLEAMHPHLTAQFGNPHSTDHAIGWKAAQSVEQAAVQVAALIGADAGEIIFTSGATEANNTALLGITRPAISRTRRKRILIGATEHKCVLEVGGLMARDMGLQVERVPVDKEGFVRAEALDRMLGDDVFIVSLMAVNNEIGTVQDVSVIAELCRKYGAMFHCDAAQAPLAMDITGLAADAATRFTGRWVSAHSTFGMICKARWSH